MRKTTFFRFVTVIVGALVTICFPSIASATICLPDVLSQFDALKHHAEFLGFHIGVGHDLSAGNHLQGIARSQDLDGTPYLFFSTGPDDDEGADLLIVEMGSRDKTGERLRSNRLEKDKETKNTAPDIRDIGKLNIHFDGLQYPDYEDTYPNYNHAGGMQIVDNVLVLALEGKRDEWLPDAAIVFIDVQEPLNPKLLYAKGLSHSAGTVGITKYSTSQGERYLVVVGGAEGNQTLHFYESNTDNLRDPDFNITWIDYWFYWEKPVDDYWPLFEWGYQTLNFVKGCNGQLYVIGMHSNSYIPNQGDDWIDLWQVNWVSPDGFKLDKISKKHVWCRYIGVEGGDFAAASGVYVSPGQELIIYGAPHDNEGPYGTVEISEFRHRDVRYTGTCTRGTGWAELYDDTNFDDRSIVFDWADRNKDDFDNFSLLDGFDGKTSSLRWCAPLGCNIIVYENPYYGGVSFSLPGTGKVEEIPDGGSWVNSIRFDPNSICENSLPIADAGPDQIASAGPDCTGTVILDGSASSDPEADPLTYTWSWDGNMAAGVSPTIRLPVGTTTITLVVNDGIADSEPDTVDITVIDDTPPEMSLSASPHTLWPPNHKMVPVTIAVSASDNCDPAPTCEIISVTSNEPVNGLGDGNKSPDWEITGDLTGNLRAERSGSGSGRMYTVEVECTDAFANSSIDTVCVHVPHDNSHRPDLIDDDGDGYSENQGDCNDNDKTIYPGAEEICGDGIDQNCNGRDLPCGADSDGDGIPNGQDSCPDSDLTETVVIEGCDSEVSNVVLSTGCTISDQIGECKAASSNHGQYVSCVSHLTNDLKHDGVLTGCEKGAIQNCVASDGDRDGVPDPLEQGTQGADPTYDGNKDGMADCRQGNVVSCHTYDGEYFVTMAGSTPISGAAAADKPPSADFPSGVEFPYGFFEFTLHVLNAGGATKMIMYLPVGADPSTYYKYGPTPHNPTDHWYEFMYDAKTQTGAQINGNVITLHFVDGQRGDDDLIANSTITDLGGPAFTTTNTTASTTGSGGCFVATAGYGSPMEP